MNLVEVEKFGGASFSSSEEDLATSPMETTVDGYDDSEEGVSDKEVKHPKLSRVNISIVGLLNGTVLRLILFFSIQTLQHSKSRDWKQCLQE